MNYMEVKRTIRLESLEVHSGYKMLVLNPETGEFHSGTFNYAPAGASFVHLRGKKIIPVEDGSVVQVISYSGGRPKGKGTFKVVEGAKKKKSYDQTKPARAKGRGNNGELGMNGLEKHIGEEILLGVDSGERSSGRLQVERGEFYLATTAGKRVGLKPGNFVTIAYPNIIRTYRLVAGKINPELTWPGTKQLAAESFDSAGL